MSEPDPYALWKQAGGGTPGYDRRRYLDLMHEHGFFLRPGDDGYDEAERSLPCGWPGTTKPVSEDEDRW